MLNVFATFLLAHLIADFPLQTNKMIALKKQGSMGICLHVLVHVVIASLLLQDSLSHWLLLLLLASIHWVIDWTKIALGSDTLSGFISDQIAHVASIMVIVGIAFGLDIVPDTVLPDRVLYPAIAYAILLATMVFVWIWANHQSEEVAHSSPLISWAQRSMLDFSQRAGLALLGGVFFNLL